MNTRCRACRDGWEHCHGMLIVHAIRRVECTEDDCPGAVADMHPFFVDCEVVGCECGRSDAIAI